jgi:hypothetical protein
MGGSVAQRQLEHEPDPVPAHAGAEPAIQAVRRLSPVSDLRTGVGGQSRGEASYGLRRSAGGP